MPVVETRRLRLRGWTERDFPEFARYYSDEDERPATSVGKRISRRLGAISHCSSAIGSSRVLDIGLLMRKTAVICGLRRTVAIPELARDGARLLAA